MTRRAVLRFGAALLAALPAFRAAAALDYTRYALGPKPSSVMLTFAEGPGSRVFAWQTDASVTNAEVRLVEGVADAAGFESAPLVFAGCSKRQEIRNAVRHGAVATGLRPGARYSYRIGGAGHYAYGAFSVRKPQNALTALNFNDVQIKRPDRLHMWEETLAAAKKAAGGGDSVDFILNGGDFIDAWFWKTTNFVHGTVSRPIEWAVAADTASAYYPSVPWVSAPGNHDFWLYDSFTATRRNRSVPGGCQSFDYARVHIAAIPYVEKTSGRRFEQVRSWLASDLKAARKRAATDWTVVCLHWGPYTTGDHGAAGATTNIVLKLAPLFASNRVDLVLQAHDHTVSKTLPYRWDGPGYTLSDNDEKAVNLKPEQTVSGDETYDLDPCGTYYVSCGCAGHRVGENAAYARIDGKKSFARRRYKIAIGRLNVDSRWGKRGDPASADLDRPMFGVLRIDGNRLEYDFLVASPGGEAVLYDTLRIMK